MNRYWFAVICFVLAYIIALCFSPWTFVGGVIGVGMYMNMLLAQEVKSDED